MEAQALRVFSLIESKAEVLPIWILGWGVPLTQYLSVSIVNDAVAGESARSYSEQDLFTNLVSSVKSGDYVIIEFGHNDASAGSVDNGKQDAVGDGYNITSTVTTSRSVDATL